MRMGLGHRVYVVRAKKRTDKRTLTERRKRAWETRRKKYGPRGHDGSYSR